MPVAGGLNDQPAWLIDTLSWFLPKYELMKFGARMDMIFGGKGGEPKKGLTPSGLKQIARSK